MDVNKQDIPDYFTKCRTRIQFIATVDKYSGNTKHTKMGLTNFKRKEN